MLIIVVNIFFNIFVTWMSQHFNVELFNKLFKIILFKWPKLISLEVCTYFNYHESQSAQSQNKY